MPAESVYVVTTTLNPGTQLRVSRNEYDRLIELGYLSSLIEIIAPTADIVVSTTEPPAPAVGLIWHNPTVPA